MAQAMQDIGKEAGDASTKFDDIASIDPANTFNPGQARFPSIPNDSYDGSGEDSGKKSSDSKSSRTGMNKEKGTKKTVEGKGNNDKSSRTGASNDKGDKKVEKEEDKEVAVENEEDDDISDSSDNDEDEEGSEDEGEEESVHSEEAIRLAKHHGYELDDLKEFTPEQLDKHLAMLDRRELKLQKAALEKQKEGKENKKEENKSQDTKDSAKKPDEKSDENSGETDDLDDDFEIPGFEDLDEVGAGVVTALKNHYSKRLKGQESRIAEQEKKLSELSEQLKNSFGGVDGLMEVVKGQQRQLIEGEIETFFSKLTDEYRDDYGTGHGRRLEPTSKQFKNRDELIGEAFMLLEADAKSGRNQMSLTDALDRALKIRSYDKQYDLARKSVAAEVEERKKSSIMKPNKKRTHHKNSVELAAENAERFYREHNLGLGNEDYDELAAFE